MEEFYARKTAVKIAWHYLGKFYKWGGDDPGGFDCSGLAIECLKSVGALKRKGDWTANDLALICGFKTTRHPQPGDLVFWNSASHTRIVHVEIYIGNGLAIGASGGGSWCVDLEHAIAQNAFIKIRPIESRPSIWGYVNPYLRFNL